VFGVERRAPAASGVRRRGARWRAFGRLYAFYFKFLSPAPFGLTSSINLLIACIFGGMSAIPFGAVLGASASPRSKCCCRIRSGAHAGTAGARRNDRVRRVLIGVLLRWPGGIWSALQRLWPHFSVQAQRATSNSRRPSAAQTGEDPC
jgi:hypothetical protein